MLLKRLVSPKTILLIIGASILISAQELNFQKKYPNPPFVQSTLSDVPRRADLPIYIKTLDNVLSFCLKNRNTIDLNFEFGLLIANVNLKQILNSKKDGFPSSLRKRLTELVRKADKILSVFIEMVNQDRNPKDQKNKLILSLFMNETQWMDRIRNFDTVLWKPPQSLTQRQREEMFINWDTYYKNMNNIQNIKPKPHESDICLISLAMHPVKPTDGLPKCKVSKNCYDIIINGSDFGYALSHRLLLLLLARFGRGCTFFTPYLDRELTRRFCMSAYWESEFIAANGFQAADLMLEQMVLCSLDGEVHFLRRSWIKELIRLQTKSGCFALDLSSVRTEAEQQEDYEESMNEDDSKQWQFLKGGEQHMINNGLCNGHETAVAAGLISTAIRFITTVYY